MHFLRILFYNYYYFQQKVGNGDIAVGAAILMILFSTCLYGLGVGFFLHIYTNGLLTFNEIKLWLLPVVVFLAVILIAKIGMKGKYKSIIKEKSYGSLLFKYISLLFFIGGPILIGLLMVINA